MLVSIKTDISGLASGLHNATSQVQQAGAQINAAGAGMGGAFNPLAAGAKTAASEATAAINTVRQQAYALAGVGAAVTAFFAAPAAALAASVSEFSDFDAALTKSTAIMDGVTSTMRDKLAIAALDLSKTLTVSAKDAAASFYFLASAGLTVDEQIAALPVVANFAKAGLVSVNEAASILTRTQFALGLSSKDAAVNTANLAMISDVLVKADTLALGRTQEFAAALTNKGATAMKTFGISLLDGISILAAFSQAGIRGAQAGTYFEMAVRQLTQATLPTSKFRAEWEKLGIAVYDASGALRPLPAIITDMQAKFGSMSTEAKKTELGLLGIQSRAQFALLPLLGLSGTINDLRTKFEDFGGTAARVAQNQMQTFSQQMELLHNRITAVGITIGGPLAHAISELGRLLEPAFKAVEGLALAFSRLPDGIQQVIAGTAALVTGAGLLTGALLLTGAAVLSVSANLAVLGGGTAIMAALAGAATLLANPIVLATAAVAGLALVFGAAYAATVQLNAKLDQTYTSFEKFSALNAAMVPLSVRLGEVSSNVIQLNQNVILAKVHLADVKTQMDAGEATAADYTKAILALNTAYKALDVAANGGSFSVQDFGIKLKMAGTASEEVSGFTQRLKDNVEAATAKVVLAKQAWAEQKGTWDDVVRAQAELSTWTSALGEKFKKLGGQVKQSGDAAKEAKKAAEELASAYDTLGLSSKKLDETGKSLNVVFDQQIKRYYNIGDPAKVFFTLLHDTTITQEQFYTATLKTGFAMAGMSKSSEDVAKIVSASLNPALATGVENLEILNERGSEMARTLPFLRGDMVSLTLALATGFPVKPVDDYSERIKSLKNILDSLGKEGQGGGLEATFFTSQLSNLETLQGALGNTDRKAQELAASIIALGKDGITTSTAYAFMGQQTQAALQQTADAAYVAYQKIADSAGANSLDALRAWLDYYDKARAAGETFSQTTQAQTEQIRLKVQGTVRDLSTSWALLGKQITQAISQDLSRAVGDAIFQTGKLGDAFKRMGQDVVDIILKKIIADGINKLLNSLASVQGVIGKIAGWFGGIASSAGINIPIDRTLAGSSAAAATQAAGLGVTPGFNGTLPPVGGASSRASDTFGGLLSAGVSSTIGLITGAVSAISSVVGNFQQAHANSDLTKIEESTRFAWLTLGGQGNSIVNNTLRSMFILGDVREQLIEIHDFLGFGIADRLATLNETAARIYSRIDLSGSGGNGGGAVTNNFYGGIIVQAPSNDPAAMAEALFRQLHLVGVKT
ncbi:MAG: phage tail tape measure protein [Bryobacteraceae bacterium]